jgi:hypothetical protein
LDLQELTSTRILAMNHVTEDPGELRLYQGTELRVEVGAGHCASRIGPAANLHPTPSNGIIEQLKELEVHFSAVLGTPRRAFDIRREPHTAKPRGCMQGNIMTAQLAASWT